MLCVIAAADVGQFLEVALQRSGEVAVEPSRTRSPGLAFARLGEAAGDDPIRVGRQADGGAGDLRRLAREQRVDEVDAPVLDLGLGQRPQREAVDPAGQGVEDPLAGQDVRRSGDDEPPRDRVRVDCLLELQQQVGRAVDLVDERRAAQARDEPGRVVVGGLARGRFVEAELAHRPGAAWSGELADQRGLADLARPGDEDDPRVVDAVGDQRLHASIDQPGHDAAWIRRRTRTV